MKNGCPRSNPNPSQAQKEKPLRFGFCEVARGELPGEFGVTKASDNRRRGAFGFSVTELVFATPNSPAISTKKHFTKPPRGASSSVFILIESGVIFSAAEGCSSEKHSSSTPLYMTEALTVISAEKARLFRAPYFGLRSALVWAAAVWGRHQNKLPDAESRRRSATDVRRLWWRPQIAADQTQFRRAKAKKKAPEGAFRANTAEVTALSAERRE